MAMMPEFLVGAGAGVAATETSKALHQEHEDLDLLKNIHSTLCSIERFFREQPSNKPDVHKTLNVFNEPQRSILRFNAKNELPPYLTLHIAVPVPATINIYVSGLPPFQLVFAAAPTPGQFAVGQYIRWRYPEGTQLSVQTPTLVGLGATFPIDLLYSDELGD